MNSTENWPRHRQLDAQGRLQHLLAIDGLPRALLLEIFDTAASFINVGEKTMKKAPILRGKTVVNLFFEASTRTRTTFEVAAKRLSADVLNLNISTSATSKGESLLDTLHNLQAMQADMFIVRHEQSGAAEFIAEHVAPQVSVINAGDGSHAHPTQALLDAFTVQHFKGEFSQLCIAIVGDILHSRVARSEIMAFHALGVGELRVIAPKTLLPKAIESLGVQVFTHLDAASLKDVDVIIMLRIQNERIHSSLLMAEEYFYFYGLTLEKLRLAKPEAIVMHPGPINRGVEIDSAVADCPQSVILQQVTFGIAVRMAIMTLLAGQKHQSGVVG